MIYENSENITVSNPSVAFFGKKSDLKYYSITCKELTKPKVAGTDIPLSYRLYWTHQDTLGNSFMPISEDSIISNVTVSDGIFITY